MNDCLGSCVLICRIYMSLIYSPKSSFFPPSHELRASYWPRAVMKRISHFKPGILNLTSDKVKQKPGSIWPAGDDEQGRKIKRWPTGSDKDSACRCGLFWTEMENPVLIRMCPVLECVRPVEVSRHCSLFLITRVTSVVCQLVEPKDRFSWK